MSKLAVLAFGGNALLRGNQLGTIKEQEENANAALMGLLPFIQEGYNIVIGHGNGPQVGNILLRNEAGFNNFKIPKMPLDVCVADSQGGIGYMLQRSMQNLLKEHGIKREVVTLVTMVKVDKEDPAFMNPTKPVGGFFIKEEAELLAVKNKWVFAEDPRKRGYRRLVASPKPIGILNASIVKALAEQGVIVITVGGGGIPVIEDESGKLQGIDAVIDKDHASAHLAKEICADEFYILTDVPKVCINYQKPDQTELDEVNIENARRYLEEGHFSAGSMGPKIEACVNFVSATGKDAFITDSSKLGDKSAGTRIVKEGVLNGC
mgnify:CR=1 FL=1